MAELIIGEHNWQQHVQPQTIDGEVKGMGLVPRNYATDPVGSIPGVKAFDFQPIPRSEWSERIADQLKMGRRNSDFRRTGNNGKPIPSLDQNGQGYCWRYSVAMATIIQRAVRRLPYVRLSAHAGACLVKNYRDEGGWCGLGLKNQIEFGCPSVEFWPEKSMSRSNDTPAMRANAALYKVTEGLWDFNLPEYGQKLSFEYDVTARLLNMLIAEDYPWWSHSVCGLDIIDGATQFGQTRAESGKLLEVVEFDIVWGMNNPVTQGLGKRDINSWTDSYGDMGEFILTGDKALAGGAVAISVGGA